MDGYQWRKHGQKVTRDNPSPRAYLKCAFGPSYPMKKKAQRSVDDQSVLAANHEGEHNHPMLLQTVANTNININANTNMSHYISLGLTSSSGTNKSSLCEPPITFDLIESSKLSNGNSKNSNPRIESS